MAAVTLRQDGIEDVTTESRPLVSKAVILYDLVRGDALRVRSPGP